MATKPLNNASKVIQSIKKQERTSLFAAERCLRETFSSIVFNDDDFSIEYERKKIAQEKKDTASAPELFVHHIYGLREGLLNIRAKRIVALNTADNKSATVSGIKRNFNEQFRGAVDTTKVNISKEASKLGVAALIEASGIDNVAEDVTRSAHGVKNVVVKIDDDFIEGYSKDTNRPVPKAIQPKKTNRP